MRILAIIAGLALAACAQQEATGPTGAEINSQCGVGGKPFTESWPCVRTGLASVNTYADVKDTMIATGDYIVTQVNTGKMTDAEANLAYAEARQRSNGIVLARNARLEDRADARNAAIASYFLNRPQPTYQAPSYAPRQPVTCNRFGNTVTCY